MSIQGFTFDNQSVAAKVDGTLHQGMIEDGALYGCSISFTGSTVNIGSGLFCVGGRLGRIVGTESITTAPAYADGYARIKLVIDLSQTATKTEFSQLSFAVDYSASDAWSDLTQSNINSLDSTDTLYESEFAVVQYSGGNISNVIRSARASISAATPIVVVDAGTDLSTLNLEVGTIVMMRK